MMAALRRGLVDFGARMLAPHNRGLVLDLLVFLAGLLLARLLAIAASALVRAAQEDVHAKLVVGLFFAVLFLIQPVGPVLKRWSFHQRQTAAADTGPGCLLFWFMPVYLVMMFALCTTAAIVLGPVFSRAPDFGIALVFAGFAWSVVSVGLVFRYFLRPAKAPRWRFLTTPKAEQLGDAFVFLNAIGFQILWGGVTASETFRELVTETPLGRPGSFTDILGRLIVIAASAVLLYLPARIFYLAEDRHRALTWATIVAANMPLILRSVFATA
jgi:hypothetical protein